MPTAARRRRPSNGKGTSRADQAGCAPKRRRSVTDFAGSKHADSIVRSRVIKGGTKKLSSGYMYVSADVVQPGKPEPPARHRRIAIMEAARRRMPRPPAGGEVVRVVQNLPGVARTPLNLGPLVVRGGRPGDTDIPVISGLDTMAFALFVRLVAAQLAMETSGCLPWSVTAYGAADLASVRAS